MGNLMLLMWGCGPEYGINKEDTGIIPPIDTADRFENCLEMRKEHVGLAPNTIRGSCALYNDEGIAFEELTSFRVVGRDGTPFPDTFPIIVYGDEDGRDPYDSYPNIPNFASEPVEAHETGTDDAWWADGAAVDLGTLNDCTPTCTWDWVIVEIADPDRVDAGDCLEYTSPDLRVCLFGNSPLEYWPVIRPATQVSDSASCQPGRGRFRLVGTRAMNLDKDLAKTIVLRPFQVDGEGSLTAGARITNITPLNDWGDSLKVLRGDRSKVKIGFDDKGEGERHSMATVRAPWSSFIDGDVPGGTMFVLEEYQGESRPAVEVDMEWTCSDRVAQDEQVSLPQGYAFSLSDVECISDWAQKYTIRVGDSGGRHRWMTMEQYGFPDFNRTISLGGTKGQENFSKHHGSLSISGRILSESTKEGMLIELEAVEYRGMPVCLPGRYLLPPER